MGQAVFDYNNRLLIWSEIQSNEGLCVNWYLTFYFKRRFKIHYGLPITSCSVIRLKGGFRHRYFPRASLSIHRRVPGPGLILSTRLMYVCTDKFCTDIESDNGGLVIRRSLIYLPFCVDVEICGDGGQ